MPQDGCFKLSNSDSGKKVRDFAEQFNSMADSIRILAILLSSCQECMKSFNAINRVFDRFGASGKLKSFVVWSPAIPSLPSEENQDVFLISDEGRELARLFSISLGVKDELLHSLLLYPPRLSWDGENQVPPAPASWMHHSTSLDKSHVFGESRFGEEVKFLVEAEDPEFSERGVEDVLLKKNASSSK
jgi:hypothetical protein